MKALLFTFIRAFEVYPAVPIGGIVSTSAGFIQRPMVLAEKGKGSALPLILKPVYRDGF
jgi:hypothetical protein